MQRAQAAGAWAVINYHEENIVQQLLSLTDGKKVRVVYDSIGKATWEDSLNCLRPRGLMVSFGNASGPVTGVDLALLNQKGSLYVTRPSLKDYVTSRDTLDIASQQLFALMASGAISAEIPEQQRFPLRDAVQAHRLLESRQTQGSCLLIP
ncbi:MAG: Quinone oxidoreductase 1 [Candidatus Erwinia impunctatus]